MTPHVGPSSFPVEIASIDPHSGAPGGPLPRWDSAKAHPGGEIHPATAGWLAREELELVGQGPRDGRGVLVEVPFSDIDSAWVGNVRAIPAPRFEVVIAHPERAAGLLAGGLDHLRSEPAAGAVLQVHVCSRCSATTDPKASWRPSTSSEAVLRTCSPPTVMADDGGTPCGLASPALAAGASSVQAGSLRRPPAPSYYPTVCRVHRRRRRAPETSATSLTKEGALRRAPHPCRTGAARALGLGGIGGQERSRANALQPEQRC